MAVAFAVLFAKEEASRVSAQKSLDLRSSAVCLCIMVPCAFTCDVNVQLKRGWRTHLGETLAPGSRE